MTSQTDRGAKGPPPEIIMDLAGIPCREVSDALRGPLRRTNQNGSRNSRKIVARRRRLIYSLSISLRRSEIDAQSQVLRTKPRMRTPHLTPPGLPHVQQRIGAVEQTELESICV